MKPTVIATILIAAAGAGGLLWATTQAKTEPTSNPAAAGAVELGRRATVGAVLGVDELMRNVDEHQGPLTVEGVVSSASTGSLSLIDVAEFKHCGVTTCAELVLPVRWSGAVPSVRDTVRVTGAVKSLTEASGQKLVFEASAVSVVLPAREEK